MAGEALRWSMSPYDGSHLHPFVPLRSSEHHSWERIERATLLPEVVKRALPSTVAPKGAHPRR